MESLTISITSVVVVANIILGLIIFSRGLKSFNHILFGLIALASALWGIAIIGFYTQQYQTVFNWIVVTHSSAILIPFFFLLFSLYFPQKLKEGEVVMFTSIILLIILECLIFFSKLVIGTTDDFIYQIGSLYPLYAFVLMSFFFIGFIFSFIQIKKAKDRMEKKQAQYVLVGSFIASSLAIIPDLILPYFKVFQYTWLGPIFTIIMVVSLFLAMLKYHLFNIKVILTEVVSIVIVIALLLEILTAQTATEIFLKTIVLVIVTIFSYILIRSVYREVSQRERIEALAADLEKANVRLTELDRQKSEFVSFATHQLRAPLTAMKGYSSLLLEGDMGKLEPQAREGIQRIFDSTDTLVSIVNDYLNISRIELGAMKYAFETIDLKNLIEDTIAELKPNIEKSGLAFSFTAENGGTDWRTTADRDKLKQVIGNVIDNSMKYTPSGSIAASLSLDRAAHKFIFKVKDTGVGIAPEVLPRLFQKFSRAENGTKVNIRGTGLGLFVAKQMVEAHHGTIRAESEGEGKGSTFVVELEPFSKA